MEVLQLVLLRKSKDSLLYVYKKLSTEVNTKIANELSARLSEINSTFTAELDRINNDLNNKLNEEVNAGFGKINTELNGKLTAEAEKNKARDDDFTKETQKIFSMISTVTERLNRIEEACYNDFENILSEFISIKMIWPNVMRLSEEPISINKACPMNLKLMDLNWKVR